MTIINLAIAGDLHGSWGELDHQVLMKLCPDGLLFVGDLSDGDLKLIRTITSIPFPTAVILGNHDRGAKPSGDILSQQLRLLGERDCSWKLRKWDEPKVSVVGARPCSPGGGFYLTQQVQDVFGPVTLSQSASKILKAARQAPKQLPLVLLAHSGPTGLGSEANSLCGRDWKSPSIDWGDNDLALAIDLIRKERNLDLVVFGHMHHSLRRGMGDRKTFFRDKFGTGYLNAACVPRTGIDKSGDLLCHFSWVQFCNAKINHISHRWYRRDASIAYEEKLFEA